MVLFQTAPPARVVPFLFITKEKKKERKAKKEIRSNKERKEKK